MTGFGRGWRALKLDVRGRTFFAVCERGASMWFGLARYERGWREHRWTDQHGREWRGSIDVLPIAPWGWTALRVPFRPGFLIVPWWLALALRAWNRRWLPVELLVRLDRALDPDLGPGRPTFPYDGPLLEYPSDGCFYHEIRPRGWRHLPRFE